MSSSTGSPTIGSASRAREFPVMARTAPGALRDALPKSPPQRARRVRRHSPRSRRADPAGLHALAGSALFRLLPVQRITRGGARRPGEHRARRSSVSTGRRARRSPSSRKSVSTGGGRCSGCRNAGRGVIQDTASTATLVALVCARERATEPRRDARRTAGREAAADGVRLVAGAQLGGEGGAARGLRTRKPAHDSGGCAASTCGPMRSRRPSLEDRAAGREPCAIVATCGTTATTAFDPLAADRAAWRAARSCGCTSMPRWPVRR